MSEFNFLFSLKDKVAYTTNAQIFYYKYLEIVTVTGERNDKKHSAICSFMTMNSDDCTARK